MQAGPMHVKQRAVQLNKTVVECVFRTEFVRPIVVLAVKAIFRKRSGRVKASGLYAFGRRGINLAVIS